MPAVSRATKGKVERPGRYLRGNFVYGRTFLQDADLDHQRPLCLERVANVRLHGTTRERPRVRLDREERFLLRPLARRRLQAARRSSRLPVVKQLGDFVFTFQPSLRRDQIESLHELEFIERRENVIFLGPRGVGRRTWRTVSPLPRHRAAGACPTARWPT